MKKTEFSQYSFNNIQDLIKFTDQKSGATLIIVGIMLTLFIEYSKKLEVTIFSNSNFIGILTILFGLSFIIISVIIIYISVFGILRPRLAKNYSKNEKSILYFEHLAEMEKEVVKKEYSILTEERMLKLINDQNTENSKILIKKIKNLNISFNYLFASVILLILFIFSSILIK